MRRILALLALLCASRMATAAPLTFNEAIALARRQNPSAASTRAQIDRALAILRQVRGAALPSLTANASYTRLDNDRVLADRVLQNRDTFSANFTATLPIVPSRIGAWKRASEQYEVARKLEAATDRDIAVVAARAYFAVLLQRRSLVVAGHARDIAVTRVKFASQRLKGGVGTGVDLARAQVELEATEAQLIDFRLAEARAIESLTIALGLEQPVSITDELPPHFQIPNAVEADVVLGRPDLLWQQASLTAARRAVGDAWLDYLPSLQLVFQPFYQNPPTLTLPEFGWQAQVQLTLPLYDGGVRYGLQRERRAALLLARSQYDTALVRARSDLRLAQTSLVEATRALERANSAARFAREVAELQRVGYQAGATTNFELLDADRRARDSELRVTIAEDDVRQAELDTLAASGQFP
jgi:outer membrane protein TolC